MKRGAITIREAVPGDGAFIMRTTRALAESHDVGHTVTAVPQDFEDALFRPNPIIGALIAEVDGTPAGAVVWHRSFTTNRGREVMYLEDISVLQEFRGAGVGAALMRKTAAVARDRGFPSIYWLLMDWNGKARRFYERLGAEIEQGFTFCRLHGEALAALAAQADTAEEA
jgi:GNAT superfamily N-acetyltransferase